MVTAVSELGVVAAVSELATLLPAYIAGLLYSGPLIILTSIVQTIIMVFSCALNRTAISIQEVLFRLSRLFTYLDWHFQDFLRRGPDNGGSTLYAAARLLLL